MENSGIQFAGTDVGMNVLVRPSMYDSHHDIEVLRDGNILLRNDADFDNILDSMKTKNTMILLRQDWFIVDWYQRAVASSVNYMDTNRFNELKRLGDMALANDDIDQLRQILFELLSIQIHADSGTGMFDIANIIKG